MVFILLKKFSVSTNDGMNESRIGLNLYLRRLLEKHRVSNQKFASTVGFPLCSWERYEYIPIIFHFGKVIPVVLLIMLVGLFYNSFANGTSKK